jgi:hypothetical protein
MGEIDNLCVFCSLPISVEKDSSGRVLTSSCDYTIFFHLSMFSECRQMIKEKKAMQKIDNAS